MTQELLLLIFLLQKNEETENQTLKLIADVNFKRNFSEKMDTFSYKLAISDFVLWSIALF